MSGFGTKRRFPAETGAFLMSSPNEEIVWTKEDIDFEKKYDILKKQMIPVGCFACKKRLR